MVVGPCKALMPSWYYDNDDGRCMMFDYGGCQGNENRFTTRAECDRACHAGINDFRLGKLSVQAYGNGALCNTTQRSCSRSITMSAYVELFPEVDICMLPKVSGPCEALAIVWHYNSEEMSCMTFEYGGCQGNGNNFPTLEECERACKPGRIHQIDYLFQFLMC